MNILEFSDSQKSAQGNVEKSIPLTICPWVTLNYRFKRVCKTRKKICKNSDLTLVSTSGVSGHTYAMTDCLINHLLK